MHPRAGSDSFLASRVCIGSSIIDRYMKTTFRTAIKSRSFAVPLLVGGAVVLLLCIVSAFNIRASELQVPVRYTSFGVTNFYTEQWFYQLVFPLFGVLILALHTAFSLQLYKKKGERFAVAFQWFTVVLLILVLSTVLAIFRVADLL